jgi:D-alanyl-D-alanine dipeptidase
MFLGIMRAAGFEHHPREWWHYQLPNYSQYPILSSGDLAT